MRTRRHCTQFLVLAVLLIVAAKLYTPGSVTVRYADALTRTTQEIWVGANRNLPDEAKNEEQRHDSVNTTSLMQKNTPVENPKDGQKRNLTVEKIKVEDGRKHNSVTNTSSWQNATVEKPKEGPKRKKHPYYKYVPDESAAEEKFLSDRKAVQSVPTEAPGWSYNKTAADLFRKQILHGDHLQDGSFVTTQENAPLNFAITRYEHNTTLMNVSKQVLHRFPKKSPFKARAADHYQTCSVVGNGGILKRSGCGKAIDASEFVFRCNFAPMGDEYVRDIGNKTSLITLNPGMIEYQYNSFKNETKPENIAVFVRDLSKYGDSYLWIPAFFRQDYVDLTFATHQALQEISHKRNQLIIPHPDFIKSAQAYWSRNGLGDHRATTGLYLITAASQICEKLHLYGFWPFHADRNNRRLTEHYFDNSLPTRAHNVPDEFKQLLRLHNSGVLRLTTRACQSGDSTV